MYARLLIFIVLKGMPALCVLAEELKPAAVPPLTAEFPLPNPSEIGSERFSLILNKFIENRGYENWAHDAKPRTTGLFSVNDAGLVHDQGIHG